MAQKPTRSLSSLGARQNQAPDKRPPELMHHAQLEYQGVNCETAVLLPGQLLPVWDLRRWRLVESFQAHCVEAVRYQGQIVALECDESPTETLLEELFDGRDSDPAYAAAEARLESMPLGNVGGIRVARPDLLPIGVLPMAGRWPSGNPGLTYSEMGILDWARLFQGVERVPGPAPRFQFFTEAPGSGLMGYDVREEGIRDVIPVRLPFSWSSAQELGLLGEGDSDDHLAIEIAGAVRQLSHRYDWGTIYVGMSMVPEGEQVLEEEMDKEQFMAEFGQHAALFTLPYRDADPLGVINGSAASVVQQLIRGVGISRRRGVNTAAELV